MKIYDGSTWLDIKALKLYDNAAWNSAIKGWAHDGTQWKIMYPNYTAIIGSYPSISGSSYPGATLTANVGDWNQTPSYAPTQYFYQWKSNNSNIYGATNNTLEIPQGYTGNQITCSITARNARGDTTFTSSNAISVAPPPVTGITLTDLTPTPSTPSVNVSDGGTANYWVATWADNASYYSVSATSGTVNTGGAYAYSTNATPGGCYVYVTSYQSGSLLRATWNGSAGATGYELSWNGSANGTATTTNLYYDIAVNGNVWVNIRPLYNSVAGEWASNYGGTSTKASGTGSGYVNVIAPLVAPSQPSPYGSDNISPTGGTFYWGASSGSPTITYYYTIYRNGSYYTAGNTTGTSVQVFAAGSMEIYVYASGPGGTSGTGYASSTFTTAGTAPSITVSNNYDGYIGGKYQWTLTINNTSGTAATSYSWGVQFASQDGGPSQSSTTGSGGSIPAGGSVTVTRNSSYTWCRWVNVVASNSYGSSSTLSTAWK